VLWIVFKIPFIIGDLSGKNAQRSIEQLRLNNERSGSKTYRPSAVNLARGKVTAPMLEEKNNQGNNRNQIPETGLIRDASGQKVVHAGETEPLHNQRNSSDFYGESATEPLYTEAENATMPLDGQRTDEPVYGQYQYDDPNATVPLYGDGETTPLYEYDFAENQRTGGMQIELLEEVILIHTREVIL
jgi:hypothetical protein